MHVQDKILILEPLELEWGPFYVPNKDDLYMETLLKNISKKNYVSAGLAKCRGHTNTKILITGANSEKRIRMDSTVLSFFKQVLLLWFQDYCKRSERLQNYGFK